MEYFKIDTAHNAFEVRQDEKGLELRDSSGALHSRIDTEQPDRLAMRNLQFMVSVMLFIPPPQRILLLGVGAGSLLHFLRRHYDAEILAVDIDAELIEQLQQIKILPAEDSRLRYLKADALTFLEDSEDRFDLILFDIFDGGQSPAWIREQTNLRLLQEQLNADGALAFNLLIDSDHAFSQFYQTLQRVFTRQTLSTPVDELENTIVFGFRSQLPERGIEWYLEKTLDLSRDHGIDYLQILSTIYTGNPQGTI